MNLLFKAYNSPDEPERIHTLVVRRDVPQLLCYDLNPSNCFLPTNLIKSGKINTTILTKFNLTLNNWKSLLSPPQDRLQVRIRIQ